ncbi:hypothetical protein OJAV_G00106070 [Oryzias javanicus]|uniref:Serum response factor-binding protein 1 n=1 Tax=Oryzias javanicus TaxID=123683 RepID=A0A437CVU2_ORYJA|nr:hypothetical protein OJAV_G00106070 [Oryzias javanicus]
MINIKEQMEPLIQDQEKNKASEVEDDEKKQEEEAFSNSGDDDDEEEEAAADTLQSTDGQEKHQQVLNLNNEVVKMRKEVKRVRALIIRKLARQIAALKKKKGKDAEIERHQRRAARLLEEVHIMKTLSPDQVTKTALQKSLNFEQVCKNPKSSLTDRALARIATHPQFSKKIDDIKTSVKAFEVERSKGGGKAKVQKAAPQSVRNQEEEDKSGSSALEATDSEEEEEEEKEEEEETIRDHKTVFDRRPESVSSADVIKITDSKAAKNDSNLQSATVSPQRTAEDDETDAESAGGEEKEYFDDSTEERFYKQSSQSEDSDDDDFFLGKVSKLKKRRKKPKTNEEEKVKKDSSEGGDKLQKELDELESRLKPKTTSLQSVFCSSLARRKGGGGEDKHKGFGKFKGHKTVDGRPDKDFPPQKQEKGSNKYSKPCPGRSLRESHTRGFASSQRGVGRGRREAPRQQEPKAGGVSSSQPALHPSWEASKRRKEQQGQILAFQGKKIKFDDDD